jgi:hypothetical protein
MPIKLKQNELQRFAVGVNPVPRIFAGGDLIFSLNVADSIAAWKAIDIPAELQFAGQSSVAYGNNVFVVITRGPTTLSSRVWRSTDGVNWTTHVLSSSAAMEDVTFGAGRFLAVGRAAGPSGTTILNAYFTSTDGINWTQGSFPAQEITCNTGPQLISVSEYASRVDFVGNEFVVYVSRSWTNRLFLTSSTGNTGSWSVFCREPPLVPLVRKDGIYFSQAFAAPFSSDIAYVYSKTTILDFWQPITSAPNPPIGKIATNGQILVAIGRNLSGQTLSTPQSRHLSMSANNGQTWATIMPSTSELPVPDTFFWDAIVYGNGWFVAYGSAGDVINSQDNSIRYLAYSPDGINWLYRPTDVLINAREKIAYGGGKFVTASGQKIYVGTVSNRFVLPRAPSNLIATQGNGVIFLSWNAAAAGFFTLTNYVVQYSSNNGATWTTVNTGQSTATSIAVLGLALNTAYVFRVAAVNAVGTSPYSSLLSPTINIAGVPEPPLNLTATAGGNSVSLSWTAPTRNGGSTITGYAIEYSLDGGNTWLPALAESAAVGTNTAATLNNLLGGESYQFRVSAVNTLGTSVPSSVTTAVPIKPVLAITVQPQNATANLDACYSPNSVNDPVPLTNQAAALFSVSTNLNTGAITAQWQRSSNAGVSWTNVSNDRVYQTTTNQTAQGFSANLWVFSYATATGMANLANGDRFRVIIASTVDPAVSVTSNSATLTVPVPTITITQQPANRTTSIGGGSASFSVAASKNFTGSGWQNGFSYEWQRSNNGGITWTSLLQGGSTPTLSLSNLTTADDGSLWRCYVYSTIFCGPQVSVATFSNAATLNVPNPDTPTAPQNLLVGLATNGVNFTWQPPASTGGAAITDYVVQYSSDNGANWTTFSDGTSVNTSTTVTGLTTGTTYLFRVAAVNSGGLGTYAVSTAILLTTIPQSYILTTVVPSAVAGRYTLAGTYDGKPYYTSTDSTQPGRTAYLYWADSRIATTSNPFLLLSPAWYIGQKLGALPGYTNDPQVHFWTSRFAAGEQLPPQQPPAAGWAAILNGPEPHLDAGDPDPTRFDNFSSLLLPPPPVVPPAPTSVIATAISNSQVALTWLAPSNNGGAAITDYVVQYSSDNGANWTTFSDGTSVNTSTTVTGLTVAVSYIFRVAATNSVGTGSFSSPSLAVVPLSITAPDVPTNLVAVHAVTAGNNSLNLSWNAPLNNGGAAVTDYVVQYVIEDNQNWSTITDGINNNTTFSFLDAAPGTVYYFRVAAVNSAGTGGYSAVTGVRAGPVVQKSFFIPAGANLTAPTSSSIMHVRTLPRVLPGERFQVTAVGLVCYGSGSTNCWGPNGSFESLFIEPRLRRYALVGRIADKMFDGFTPWEFFGDIRAITAKQNGPFEFTLSDTAGGLSGGITITINSLISVQDDPNQLQAPTDVRVAPGNGAVSVSWTAPPPPVTNYLVQYSMNNGITWTSVNVGFLAATSTIATGLFNGGTYIFRVAAIRSGVQSVLFSTPSVGVTPSTFCNLDTWSSFNSISGINVEIFGLTSGARRVATAPVNNVMNTFSLRGGTDTNNAPLPRLVDFIGVNNTAGTLAPGNNIPFVPLELIRISGFGGFENTVLANTVLNGTYRVMSITSTGSLVLSCF